MRVSKKELIFVLLLVALLLYFLLPSLKYGKGYGKGVKITIYQRIKSGFTGPDITEGFDWRDKAFIKEYNVTWLEDALPIKPDGKVLDPNYLPPYHIVVYSYIVDRKLIGIINGSGRYPHFAPERLQPLLNATRYGTFNIILGDVNDETQITGDKDYDRTHLIMYLILKKIINRDSSFIDRIIDILKEEDHYINQWVNLIMKKSITYPDVPTVDPYDIKSFRMNWKSWIEKNKHKLKFRYNFIYE